MKSVKSVLSKIGPIILWLFAIPSMILFLLIVGIFIWAIFFAGLWSSFPEPVKNAVIPKGMKVNKPNEGWEGWPEINDFALKLPLGKDLTGEHKFAPIFNEKNREVLLRHLSTSSRWLLSEEESPLIKYATMTCEPKDNLLKSLYDQVNNSITVMNPIVVFDSTTPMRTHQVYERVVGWQDYNKLDYFSGRRHFYVDIEMDAGGHGYQGTNNKMFNLGETLLVITPEQGIPNTKVRDQLCCAIAQRVYDELKAVTESKIARRDGFDPSLMPKSSIKYGAAELKAWEKGLGTYNIAAYANPGEDGFVYLKAFEATRNTPVNLSSDLEVMNHLKRDLKQYMGWSKNPNENFLYHRECTLYAGGDSSYKFPARFELWFKPKNESSPEHKLVDAIYMVNSWER